jgi:CRP/FNR family transcriptional regulator, nitrogen oxide reductase regulator
VTSTAALLKRVTLFQSLPETALAEVVRLSTMRSVEEGGYFFMQGDEARHLYVLTVGRVKLIQLTIDGQQVAMRMVGPEQMFAGAAILKSPAGYPVSAEAVEDSSALAWESSAFKSLSEKYPQLSINLMQLMQAYILEMQSRYRELSTERVEKRVARALVRLTAQTGIQSLDGAIVLQLSRQDLAEMSGTTLFTASRILAGWERRGIVATGRERVQIINPHGLVSIAEDLAARDS